MYEKKTDNAEYLTVEKNKSLISDSYIELVREFKRSPKIFELVEKTGLCDTTVRKYFKELKKNGLGDKVSKYKTLTDRVILGIANKAIEGDSNAAKLFLEIVEGFKPGMKIEIDNKVTINTMSLEELQKEREKNNQILDDPKLLRFRNTGSD